jgi:hypothetical protein
MEWSAVTWRSASPSQQEPEHRWYGGEAVQPVFSWTLPQALPEASSGVSPSHCKPEMMPCSGLGTFCPCRGRSFESMRSRTANGGPFGLRITV